MPNGVVGECSVQHDIHQLANVWYRRGLDMKVGDECQVVGGTVDHVGRSRGRGRRRQQPFGGDCLPLEVGSNGMFLLQEQVGGLHTTTCSDSRGISGVGVLDKSIEPLSKGLGAATSSSNQEERVGVKW
jgi:hypothetical protein